MKEISTSAITAAVAQLCLTACCHLPKDMCAALAKASSVEPSPLGRQILAQLVENAHIAAQETMPICQDTGLAIIFADIGQDVHITGGDFTEAVNAGVRKG